MSSVNQQYGGSKYPHLASSTEEGESDDRQIASVGEIRKQHQRELAELGMPTGSMKKDMLMLKYLLDIRIQLFKLNKRIDVGTPMGKVKTITLNLIGGSRLTHIDFEESENSSGVPAGNVVNEPQAKLFEIHVYNDGPGQVAYGLNESKSQFEAQVGLLNGENKGFTFEIPTVKTLNILSTNGNSKVRIITLV
jgi:hypothetical protein